jgi:hypothetical protein
MGNTTSNSLGKEGYSKVEPSLEMHSSISSNDPIDRTSWTLSCSEKMIHIPKEEIANLLAVKDEPRNIRADELVVSKDILEKLIEERVQERLEELQSTQSSIPDIQVVPFKAREVYTSHQLHMEADNLLDSISTPSSLGLSKGTAHGISCQEQKFQLIKCLRTNQNRPLDCKDLVSELDACIKRAVIHY